MKENEMSDLQKDLDAVGKKWSLKNCAFCGSDNEGNFVGTQVGSTTVLSFWETSLNVGRLWQHMRTQVRNILNEHERGKDW